MNTTNSQDIIGKKGQITTLGKLNIDVTIKNTKYSYGNLRYFVSPVSGSGEVWVNADKVDLTNIS